MQTTQMVNRASQMLAKKIKTGKLSEYVIEFKKPGPIKELTPLEMEQQALAGWGAMLGGKVVTRSRKDRERIRRGERN